MKTAIRIVDRRKREPSPIGIKYIEIRFDEFPTHKVDIQGIMYAEVTNRGIIKHCLLEESEGDVKTIKRRDVFDEC